MTEVGYSLSRRATGTPVICHLCSAIPEHMLTCSGSLRCLATTQHIRYEAAAFHSQLIQMLPSETVLLVPRLGRTQPQQQPPHLSIVV